MSRFIFSRTFAACVLLFTWSLTGVGCAGGPKVAAAPGEAFSEEEQRTLMAAVLADKSGEELRGANRIRPLRMWRETSGGKADGDETARGAGNFAGVIVFNYDTGKATQFVVDIATGAVVDKEDLPGQPGPSAEERAEGLEILSADPKLSALVKAGAVSGGFLTEPPPNAPAPGGRAHRYLFYQVLASEGGEIKCGVIVDMTTKAVVWTGLD